MKLKFDRKSLLAAAILSLITLIVLLVGLITPVKVNDAFAATIVLQLGIAGLWLLAKWGAFKGFFKATRKMTQQKRETLRAKHNMKKEDIEIKSGEPLGSVGPLAMIAFGIIEVLIYVAYVYS